MSNGQPRALVGNTFSDAYFTALRQRAASRSYKCAYCGTDLSNKSRVSDGVTAWCDHGHRELWINREAMNNHKREMVGQGWTKERWDGRVE